MLYKKNWEKVKERLEALWEGEVIDRCCVSVTAPLKKGADTDIFSPAPTRNPEEVKRYWQDPETILEQNLKRIENTFFGGETLPQIFLNFGTSGHAIYFGADYELKPETIWYSPIIADWDKDEIYFDESNSFFKKQLETAKYLAEEAEDKFFVSMPDNCGTIDALAHLRGSKNLLMDMVTNKEEVIEAIHKLNKGWKKANEKFYQILKKCNKGGSTNGWMHTWAPGRQMQMQCDLSVMISPKYYQEFVIPELKEQMEWMEYPVYHFDGKEQINHLDYILNLDKLKMIQWTNVEGQENPINFLPTLKKIQQAGKGLILFTPAEDIPELLSELSIKGLYLHTTADSRADAESIIKYVEKHSYN